MHEIKCGRVIFSHNPIQDLRQSCVTMVVRSVRDNAGLNFSNEVSYLQNYFSGDNESTQVVLYSNICC